MRLLRSGPLHKPRGQQKRALLLIGATLLGCGRDSARRAGDSSAQGAGAATASVPSMPDPGGWRPADGPALLVQGASPEEAIVLVPGGDDAGAAGLDSAAAHEVVLIGRGGARFTAKLGLPFVGGSAECRLYGLRDLRGQDGAKGWAVGFVDAPVSPIALDSIEVLSSRDSSALAAEASRLASTVTAGSDASFQGLRFTAHDVRRFEAAPGVQALAAHLTRKVNQEANPQEEQTLLVAERDSGVTTGAYTLAFAERTHGLEEQIATPEVIAAARLGGTARTTLVVARDGENGVAYALLERMGTRRWRVRWTSKPTRCS